MRVCHTRNNVVRFLVLTICMSFGVFLFLHAVQTFYNYYHRYALVSGVDNQRINRNHYLQVPSGSGAELQQQQQQQRQTDVNLLNSGESKRFDYGDGDGDGDGNGDGSGDGAGSGDGGIDEHPPPLAEQQIETVPRLQALKDALQCKDRPLKTEVMQHGEYWLARNMIRGTLSTHMGCAESITYTTNGDYTFFESLATVVKRWLGPVSFALYAPGYDINGTLDSIQYVRNCLPESELIRQFVSFHVYFPATHMPPILPHSEKQVSEWPYSCDDPPPYVNVPLESLYKTKKNLTYPINVGRNIARKAVNTYFIFASDIELFPSHGMIEQFLDFVWHNRSAILYNATDKPRVFPMPVFEVYENVTVPHTKPELTELLHKKLAIPFHSLVCSNCHLVPEQKQWYTYNDTDEMAVTVVGKRTNKQKYWEPFYISDNREPMFDERVTWEGQKNKRIQGFAMCLLDYEYHILHPAFLVHTPGVKHFNKKAPRLKYVPAMNKLIHDVIIPEYHVLYGKNSKCVP